MFGRPRCREWTPLATQQLRLRSLIQIVGYNIRPPESCQWPCSFYFTIHRTTMCAPFYTSEKISSPHPKWKEIDTDTTQSMPSTNVIIRIWCHILHTLPSNERFQDTIIQTWGVYFTGLRFIGANLALNFTSECFKTNTLVFQMHGGYFASYKSLKLDVMPEEPESSSFSSSSSSKTIPKLDHKLLSHARSLSPSKLRKEKEYGHSPIERNSLKNSTNLYPNDVNEIYEHSPSNDKDLNLDLLKNIDDSETAENYDLRSENETPKCRYAAMSFLKSEIRSSYNATKLQKLHLLQYSIKKRQDSMQDVKERIYKKSALNSDCIKLDNIVPKLKRKPQRNLFSPEEESLAKSTTLKDSKNGVKVEEKPIYNGPRLTLKLNDLLSFKSKPSPLQIAEHVRLTKQLEILRFKRIILSDERDSKLMNIRRLKDRHNKLLEENQDTGSELMEEYHTLSKRNETLRESKVSTGALRELAIKSHTSLASRRAELLADLNAIFCVEQKEQNIWTICGVPLPICDDEARVPSPGEPVAAGYAAQLTCLIAAILNLPLRYRIELLGSMCKIIDITPHLPDPNIPLHYRSVGERSLFRYGMFLLNKTVGQLLRACGSPATDVRATLPNLKRLTTASHRNLSDTSKLFGTCKWFSESQCRTQSLRSLVASERGKFRPFNRFKDSVDGHSPESLMCLKRHRHTRSVGSYNDDHDIASLAASSIMGSESSIYNALLSNRSEIQARILKTHNSESDILSKDAKIVFTLGEDSLQNLEERLVRLSSNNGDAIVLDDDVRQVCTEINDFCDNNVSEFCGEFEEAQEDNFKKCEVNELCECNAASEFSGEFDEVPKSEITHVILDKANEDQLDLSGELDAVH